MSDTREQFLERFTRAIFQKRGSGFVLKGGGAMRTLFGNQRMTKDIDLDFTNPKRSAESLHNSIRSAIDSARRGLRVTDFRVAEPGKQESTPRWKINFRDEGGTPCHVEVEVSRDMSRAAPGEVVQHRFEPIAAPGATRFWVDLYDNTTLIATKVAALLGRGAPRDIYDLDLLMPAADPPSATLVRWSLARAGVAPERAREVLWDQLDGLTWARYVDELRDALPIDVAERIDEEEWTDMKLRVGVFVEQLLASV